MLLPLGQLQILKHRLLEVKLQSPEGTIQMLQRPIQVEVPIPQITQPAILQATKQNPIQFLCRRRRR